MKAGCLNGALEKGIGLLGHEGPPSTVGSRKHWSFEGLGWPSGGVGHFWGAFASVDRPGSA